MKVDLQVRPVMKVNLTIIIIQRITHAFDCTFDCAFDKSNVCGSHTNANALKNLWRHLNAHSNAQHSNVHSNAFAFVNKPGCRTKRSRNYHMRQPKTKHPHKIYYNLGKSTYRTN